MGQTLTHGVYLPSEGERNCYSGLASNWRLLDGAIGTVAAHTTAIAGKADISHTHGNISNDGKVGTDANKPLITGTGGAVQAGSFGTAANTFCEGNDSRLSDARTPVAHTHLTSDVTDLLNSAHTWTGNQTYNKTTISNAAEVLHCKNANVALGETPTSDYQKLFMFKDKNNDNFGYYRHLYQTTGSSQFDILVRNKFTNGAPDTSGSIDYLSFSLRLNADKSKEGVLMGSFKPYNTNTYDLGSSSYQWNNLYAKNYYYNGVAWGLDKANVWTDNNEFNTNFVTVKGYRFRIKNYEMVLGTVPSSNQWTGFQFVDKNNTVISEIIQSFQSSGNALYQINVLPNEANSVKRSVIAYTYNSANNTNAVAFTSNVLPASTNAYDLGSQNQKWKSLNGINPGALSLPDLTSNGYIELSNNISANTEYSYTPPADGWLALYVLTTGFHVENAVGIFNGSSSGNAHRLACSATSGINLARSNYYHGAVILPVIAGIPYLCWIKIDSSTTLASKVLYFYKAAGNV